jgi:hypothetical protein
VTSNDVTGFADKDWIREAERSNAAGDLSDLSRTVGPRIARIWDQSIERPIFDLQSGDRL